MLAYAMFGEWAGLLKAGILTWDMNYVFDFTADGIGYNNLLTYALVGDWAGNYKTSDGIHEWSLHGEFIAAANNVGYLFGK